MASHAAHNDAEVAAHDILKGVEHKAQKVSDDVETESTTLFLMLK
jgi:hypothetical protein